MNETPTLRRLDGHAPTAVGEQGWRPGMFERDDLFMKERLADLHAAAGLRDHGRDADRLVDRARRALGRRLVTVGAVVAGVSGEARGQLIDTIVADETCADCEVGAAA